MKHSYFIFNWSLKIKRELFIRSLRKSIEFYIFRKRSFHKFLQLHLKSKLKIWTKNIAEHSGVTRKDICRTLSSLLNRELEKQTKANEKT